MYWALIKCCCRQLKFRRYWYWAGGTIRKQADKKKPVGKYPLSISASMTALFCSKLSNSTAIISPQLRTDFIFHVAAVQKDLLFLRLPPSFSSSNTLKQPARLHNKTGYATKVLICPSTGLCVRLSIVFYRPQKLPAACRPSALLQQQYIRHHIKLFKSPYEPLR